MLLQMKQLRIEKNRIADKNMEYLSTCIHNIDELSFTYCLIAERGFEILSKAIEQRTTPVSSVINDWWRRLAQLMNEPVSICKHVVLWFGV